MTHSFFLPNQGPVVYRNVPVESLQTCQQHRRFDFDLRQPNLGARGLLAISFKGIRAILDSLQSSQIFAMDVLKKSTEKLSCVLKTLYPLIISEESNPGRGFDSSSVSITNCMVIRVSLASTCIHRSIAILLLEAKLSIMATSCTTSLISLGTTTFEELVLATSPNFDLLTDTVSISSLDLILFMVVGFNAPEILRGAFKSSKILVAWSTPFGAMNRLPFGIKPATSIFQREIDILLIGLPRVMNYLDDIISLQRKIL